MQRSIITAVKFLHIIIWVIAGAIYGWQLALILISLDLCNSLHLTQIVGNGTILPPFMRKIARKRNYDYPEYPGQPEPESDPLDDPGF